MKYQFGRQTGKFARGQSVGVMAVMVLSGLCFVPLTYADHAQQETPSIVEAQGCTGEYAGRSVSEEVLLAILVDHGQWLFDHHDSKGKQANLCGAELSGADFREQDLSGANFQGANLSRADFTAATLVHVNFHKANVSEASLYAVDMRGANASGAMFRLADFRKADLSQANFAGADLRKANLARDSMAFRYFTWCQFGGSLLSGRRFRNGQW